MIITLVTDTFNVHNNGTTVSAMRFAAALVARGHTVRVVACGERGNATGQGLVGPAVMRSPSVTAGSSTYRSAPA